VQDQFDITLEDSDLLGEVELTTDLIIAAAESDLPLSTAEIDRLLGIKVRRASRARLPHLPRSAAPGCP
jgi:hypothetical protein